MEVAQTLGRRAVYFGDSVDAFVNCYFDCCCAEMGDT